MSVIIDFNTYISQKNRENTMKKKKNTKEKKKKDNNNNNNNNNNGTHTHTPVDELWSRVTSLPPWLLVQR